MPDTTNENFERAKDLSAELLKQIDFLDKISKKNVEIALGQEDLVVYAEKLAAEYLRHQDSLGDILDIHREILNAVDAQVAEQNRATELAELGAEKVVEPFENFSRMIEGLPGGDFISKHFGFDKIAGDMKEKFAGAMTEFIRTGSADFSAFAASAGEALSAIVNPLTITVVLLGLALKRFIEIDQMTREIRNNTGFTGEQLRDIADYSEDISKSYAKFGINLDKSAEISQALVDTFGSTVFLTEQNADSMARLVGLLGMGAGEAATLLKIFENIAKTTGDTATNLIGATIELAKQEGVAPKDVLADIADTSQTIFEFTNGSAETIARTAVEARKLGVNLGTVESIAGNLMDFESSIESEMKAMVLTGRQLNLEQARYYAMTGETDKLLGEITKQIGTAEEISKMLPFEQKALANAIGLSVGELRNMARQQEIVNGLAEGTKDTWQSLKEGGSLEDVLKAEGVMTPLEDLQTSLKAVFVSLSSALVPVFKILVPILRVVAFVFEMVGKALNLLFKPLDMLADSFGGFDKLVTSIIDPFRSFYEWIYKVGDAIITFLYEPFSLAFKAIGQILSGENITEVFNDIIDEMKGLGENILDILVSPFQVAIDAVSNLLGDFDIFNLISDKFSSSINFISNLFSKISFSGLWDSFENLIIDITNKIKGFGKTILSLLTFPFVLSFEQIDILFDKIVVSISDKFTSILNFLSGIGESVFNVITWPFRAAWEWIMGESEEKSQSIFNSILRFLGAVGVSILNTIVLPYKKALEFVGDLIGVDVIDIINSMIMGIQNITGNLFDIITQPFTLVFDYIKNIFGNIVDLFSGEISVTEFLSRSFSGVMGFLTDIGEAIFNILVWPFKRIINFIDDAIGVDIFGFISSGFNSIVSFLSNIGGTIFDTISAPFVAVFDFIKSINVSGIIFDTISAPFVAVFDFIKSIINNIVGFFTGEISFTELLSEMFDSVFVLLSGVGRSIVSLITLPFRTVVGFIGDLIGVDVLGIISSTFNSIINLISGAGNSIVNAIISPFVTGINLIKDIFDNLINFFTGEINLADIISNVFNSIFEFLSGVGISIFDIITSPFKNAWDWLFGHTIWSAETITEVFEKIINALTAIWNGVFNILTLPFKLAVEKILMIVGSLMDRIGDFISNIGKFIGFGEETEENINIKTAPPTPEAATAVEQAAGPAPGPEITIEGTEMSTKDVVSKLEEILQALKDGKVLSMDGRKVGETIARAAVTH